MPEPAISIGLDVGTTNTKALALDVSTGEALSLASAGTPVMASRHGDLRDGARVIELATRVLAECIGGLTEDVRRAVRTIGVASLGEEAYVVDADGRPLLPSPTWYNTTCAGAGTREMDETFGWHKLAWAFGRLGADGRSEVAVGFTSLSGLIAGALSEPDPSRALPIDHTHASRTGFFDVVAGAWNVSSFAETGWSERLLPPIVAPTRDARPIDPTAASQLGLPPTVSVTSAGHDHLCAGFASGARHAGELFVSAGTAEAHVMLVDPAAVPDQPLPSGVSLGRYVTEDALYLHTQIAAGRIHQQWQALLGVSDPRPDVHAEPVERPIAVVRRGTDATVDLLGVDAQTTAGRVLGAIVEGVAHSASALDREMADLVGVPLGRIVVAGPPTSDPAWRRARVQRAAADVAVSSMTEPTAIGAALIAASARGIAVPPPALTALTADDRLRAVYRRIDDRLTAAHRLLHAS